MIVLEWLMLVVRFVVWVTDLDDGAGSADWRKSSPSITKLAGAACVVVGLRAMTKGQGSINAASNALVVAGITALFGRSMWKLWLGRNSWASSVSAAHQRNELVEERRSIDIRYTIDGVPARSLPHDPTARTAAGEAE